MRRAIRWTLIVGLLGTVLTAALVVGLHEPPPAVAVNEPASPVGLPNLNDGGAPVDLASFRGRGVLVAFWATWCEPCIAEMPLLVELHRRYAGRHFALVSVTDDDADKVRTFLTKSPLPFPVLHDRDGAVRERYGADALPYAVFIGPDGVVRGKRIGRLRETQALEAIERLIIDARAEERRAAGGDQSSPHVKE
jgi:thiol-disulfide isomerase/thioredoxin